MILSYEHKLRAHQEITGAECSSDKVRFSDTDIEQNAILWVHYAKCLIAGYSIRKSAKVVGVCVKKSFYMRHKLLDYTRTYIGVAM